MIFIVSVSSGNYDYAEEILANDAYNFCVIL